MQGRFLRGHEDTGMLRVVGAGGALLALAITVGLSFASNAADAASAPGLNGRIACEANRRTLAIPSPNPNAISNAEITSVNPDGSGEDVLTDNMQRDGDPAYSPDGKKIAFEGRRVVGQPDNSEIYVANNDGDLEGPDVKRLTFNNGERTGLPEARLRPPTALRAGHPTARASCSTAAVRPPSTTAAPRPSTISRSTR